MAVPSPPSCPSRRPTLTEKSSTHLFHSWFSGAKVVHTRQRLLPSLSCAFSRSWQPCAAKLTSHPNYHSKAITRRSAPFEPSSWDYDTILSLPNSQYLGKTYVKRIKELKEEVRHLFREEKLQLIQQLELIDAIQRSGLAHHFVDEIESTLQTVKNTRNNDDLHATALHFKLLRLHGLGSSQDMFKKFVDEKGAFKDYLKKDVKGMLSLFEASQLGFKGERLLEEANIFCVYHLQDYLSAIKEKSCHVFDQDSLIAEEIKHALDLPVCRRITWTEIRSYIEHCSKEGDKHPSLIELAQINFNIEQAQHQNELKSILRWWRKMRWEAKLEYARDRCSEAYFGCLAIMPEPHFANGREKLAKVSLLITALDDMYDVHGTIDELELFTLAVQQWDVNAIDHLPEYMQMFLLALFNEINALSCEKEGEFNRTALFSEMLANLCNAFMTEAKWFHNNYTPSLQEYLNNGSVSSSGPLILVHAYSLINHKLKDDDLKYLKSDPLPITLTSLLFRLCNDLAYSEEAKRGDVAGCVQWYARDTGLSEEAARTGVVELVDATWKRLMKECIDPASSCPKVLANLAMNLACVVQGYYYKGDAYKTPDAEMKQAVKSLLFDSIDLPLQN